jgi:hypothetical protein
MPQEYTRQRQGRDFLSHNPLRAAEMSAEGNYNKIDGIIGNNAPHDAGENAKTLHDLLEQYKKEAERNAAPVDGVEPLKEIGGIARE